MEPAFVTGFVVTLGVVGGTLINFLIIQRSTNGNGSNGNGSKEWQARMAVLADQQLVALQGMTTALAKEREESARETTKICEVLATEAQALAVMTRTLEAHDTATRTACADVFKLLRKE